MNIQDFELFKGNDYTPFENNGKSFLLNREPYLDIVVSDICNANCRFCIADLIHSKLKLDFEKAKQKIQFAIDNMRVKEVLLLGGEPTVNLILIPFIEYLRNLNLNKIIITTNGLKLRNKEYRLKIFEAGLTHLNISFMNLNPELQSEITKVKNPLTLENIRDIAEDAHHYGIKVRINNNVFKGNNDRLENLLFFYREVAKYVDSIKFSPLLKTDAFSVVDYKTEYVKTNILSDDEYDQLFAAVENSFPEVSIITNEELFGFVKNSMIPLKVPILLNWNQHGKMMRKVIDENKINNLKILPNAELSLSWNRELTEYYIKTE